MANTWLRVNTLPASRSLGAGEMWLYNKNGGEGIQLNSNAKTTSKMPANLLYHLMVNMFTGARTLRPALHFEYNKDPNAGHLRYKTLKPPYRRILKP
jgi:hypothetical protein